MTAAALRCAVISDPRIFENEPACTCNYSSSDYMVVKGFPLLLLFFFSFLLILLPLFSAASRQMLQTEREHSVALEMVCSVH